jgi:hypothetical protein
MKPDRAFRVPNDAANRPERGTPVLVLVRTVRLGRR